MNKIQLTASGIPGLLIRGRRDNGNAHGFDVLTIYALAVSKEKPDANFLVVPVWVPGGKEQLELAAGGGADCKLRDFRFVSGPGRDLQLITAEREYGTSYVDEGIVTFTYYQLEQNPEYARFSVAMRRMRCKCANTLACESVMRCPPASSGYVADDTPGRSRDKQEQTRWQGTQARL
jgi:hypothetical protein